MLSTLLAAWSEAGGQELETRVAGTIIDDANGASPLRALGRAVRSRLQDGLDPRDRVQVVESRGAMGDRCRGS